MDFPRPSSDGVLMIVAAALAALAACVALVVLAQEPARATFPGKNGKIAFVGGDADGNIQIFTVSPSGANLRQLTRGESIKTSPTWSADGRKIAFVVSRGEPHGMDIYTMNADGSEQAAVTRGRKDDSDPSWSPDGRRLVFSRQVTEARPETGELGNRELFAVNSDGTHPVRLTRSTEMSELDPAWSPDGTKIAFSTLRFDELGYDIGYGSIYAMKADGSEPPAVLNGFLDQFGRVDGLGWSPNGQWLVYTQTTSHGSGIGKMSLDGSRQGGPLIGGDNYGCVPPLPHYSPHSPDWSPDGKKIVFADFCSGLVTMDSDGENLRSIFEDWAEQPSWRPVVR